MKKAWQLLEAGWIQRSMARTATGAILADPTDERACQFCAVGAVIRAYGRETAYDILNNKIRPHLPAHKKDGVRFPTLMAFNDDTTTKKEDVVGLLKELDI